ncbi:hypothetical protein [Streptomyces sp. NPDC057838]|uniref:hypothetical protein n=1 Tax=unclassified Streptomyces TaxID=2593676 RepID=UPI0036846715
MSPPEGIREFWAKLTGEGGSLGPADSSNESWERPEDWTDAGTEGDTGGDGDGDGGDGGDY